jgi:ribokinase
VPFAPPIVVIGSINTDFILRAPRVPAPGETVLGSDLLTLPGGKGANQAVAAARLGGRVHMVGRVGDDPHGARLRGGLASDGVNVDHVAVTRGVASGCAMILVDDRGENSIVVSPGANARLTPKDVDRAKPVIRAASAVVMQLEVPAATVRHALAMCRKLGVRTILDPAPVPPKGLPPALYRADLITPNEHEGAQLAGMRSARRIVAALLARGAGAVVLKLGEKGALFADANARPTKAPPFRVRVVDTTAAGDAFTGALAVGLAEGRPLGDAVRFASAAGALCCTKLGARPALPSRRAVARLLTSG